MLKLCFFMGKSSCRANSMGTARPCKGWFVAASTAEVDRHAVDGDEAVDDLDLAEANLLANRVWIGRVDTERKLGRIQVGASAVHLLGFDAGRLNSTLVSLVPTVDSTEPMMAPPFLSNLNSIMTSLALLLSGCPPWPVAWHPCIGHRGPSE